MRNIIAAMAMAMTMIAAQAARAQAGQGCPPSQQLACTVQPAIVLAGIGALLDAAHKGRTTIYDSSAAQDTHASVRIAPIVDAHRTGVLLSLTRVKHR
jgi:hypothetical protein